MTIKNLDINQAVKFGDSFLVVLKDGSYLIDGERVILSGNYTRKSTYNIREDSKILKIISHGSQPSHYVLKSGKEMSFEEYNNTENDIFGEYKDEDGYISYPSTEIEIEVKQKWIPYENATLIHRELPETYEKVEISVVGEWEKTPKHITSAISLGKLGFGNTDKMYSLDVSSATMDVWDEFAIKYATNPEFTFTNDAERNYLRFAKINDKFFVLGGQPLYEKNKVYLYGDLESAKAGLEKVQSQTRKDILKHVSPQYADQIQIKDMITYLESLDRTVRGIDSKVKTRDKKRAALISISKKIDQLEKHLSILYTEEEQ